MAKSLVSTMAGMSAPQGLLVATAVTGYLSWSYSSAAKLQDNMETQVYVRTNTPPAESLASYQGLTCGSVDRGTRCAWKRR